MGILDNLLGSKPRGARTPSSVSREPKYVELEWEGGIGDKHLTLRVVNFNEFSDVEGILELFRNRKNMIVLKVKQRLVQEKMELKRALKRLQRSIMAVGGDIVAIDEKIFLIAPPSVEIMRSAETVIGEPGTTAKGPLPTEDLPGADV